MEQNYNFLSLPTCYHRKKGGNIIDFVFVSLLHSIPLLLQSPESAWDKVSDNIKFGCYGNTSSNFFGNLQIFDVNVKSAALLVKEAHPHLKASGWGLAVTP